MAAFVWAAALRGSPLDGPWRFAPGGPSITSLLAQRQGSTGVGVADGGA